MPELPDLVHVAARLKVLEGLRLQGFTIKDPVLVRNHLGDALTSRLEGARITRIFQRAPFLTVELDTGTDIIVNPMLAGRFFLIEKGAKARRGSFALALEDGSELVYTDDKSMGKIYLIPHGATDLVPRYEDAGLDILNPDVFTLAAFIARAAKSRQQVRVFLMDSRHIRDIGNAYADEILFEARIHPKTFLYQLTDKEKETLYQAVRSVIAWGIEEVEKAAAPTQEKVRGHMRVRNRKDQPCPRCGTKIRRVAVLSSDAFFCPTCQPVRRELFIDWNKAGGPEGRRPENRPPGSDAAD